MKAAKVRLFVAASLSGGVTLRLDPAATHYAAAVRRLGVGDSLALFNGRDGEWRATITEIAREGCAVAVADMSRPQTSETDVWIAAAPIKRARMTALVEKATELGVSRVQPVVTRRTVVSRINAGRLLSNARRAAEQCGRLSAPGVGEPQTLERFLGSLDPSRGLLWCDESGDSPPIARALDGLNKSGLRRPWAVLIGPEGGFDRNERTLVSGHGGVLGVDLGPRLLRSETAATVALGILQSRVAAPPEANAPQSGRHLPREGGTGS